jgi:hypothetical protein
LCPCTLCPSTHHAPDDACALTSPKSRAKAIGSVQEGPQQKWTMSCCRRCPYPFLPAPANMPLHSMLPSTEQKPACKLSTQLISATDKRGHALHEALGTRGPSFWRREVTKLHTTVHEVGHCPLRHPLRSLRALGVAHGTPCEAYSPHCLSTHSFGVAYAIL